MDVLEFAIGLAACLKNGTALRGLLHVEFDGFVSSNGWSDQIVSFCSFEDFFLYWCGNVEFLEHKDLLRDYLKELQQTLKRSAVVDWDGCFASLVQCITQASYAEVPVFGVATAPSMVSTALSSY